MKTVEAMFGIILVLMFLVPIGLFIADSLGLAQEAGNRGANINNTEAMTQLIMYSTYTAYQCTPDAGGFERGTNFGDETYWASWEEVYQDSDRHNGFQQLENAYDKDELNCYGAENKLPLSQGAWEEVEEGIREDDFWINDQEGKYSKRDFTITRNKDNPDQGVRIGPCIVYDERQGGGIRGDFTAYVTGDRIANHIRFYHAGTPPASSRKGIGMGGQGRTGHTLDMINFRNECMQPDESLDHETNEGPLLTVTVMGVTDDMLGPFGSEEVTGFENVDPPGTGAGKGWDHQNIKQWIVCPGTEGYIQVNTGKNREENDPWSDWDGKRDKPYDPENGILPGKSDIEAGGSYKTNTVHPFIVLTEVVKPNGAGSCPEN